MEWGAEVQEVAVLEVVEAVTEEEQEVAAVERPYCRSLSGWSGNRLTGLGLGR